MGIHFVIFVFVNIEIFGYLFSTSQSTITNHINQILITCNTKYTITLHQHPLDTTICDQVCQWLATGQWFSPGIQISSTNKTDRRDITEHRRPSILFSDDKRVLSFIFQIHQNRMLWLGCWWRVIVYFVLHKIDDDHELFILTSAPNFNKLNHFKNTHVQHYLIVQTIFYLRMKTLIIVVVVTKLLWMVTHYWIISGSACLIILVT
jgi:hypothetical protein